MLASNLNAKFQCRGRKAILKRMFQAKPLFHPSMDSIEHKTLNLNDINMHLAEKGPSTGPVILFIHGFPELWYSWRHQILTLSNLGYRCIAPDLRGFGDTDCPNGVENYTLFHIVGDLVALLDIVEAPDEKVFVVGHDWGAIVAWHLSLYRPDKVRALVNLSVAYSPRKPIGKPVEIMRRVYGDEFYICRIQVTFFLTSISVFFPSDSFDI